MLKHDHDLKNDLRDKDWYERDKPEVYQTSFLRSENQVQNLDLSLNVFGLDQFYIVMLFSHDYRFNSETRISTISLFAKDSGRVQSIDMVSQIKPKLGVSVLKI